MRSIVLDFSAPEWPAQVVRLEEFVRRGHHEGETPHPMRLGGRSQPLRRAVDLGERVDSGLVERLRALGWL